MCKFIGGFDVLLVLVCVGMSKFVMVGYGVSSAAFGFVFMFVATYFTFENKFLFKKMLSFGVVV